MRDRPTAAVPSPLPTGGGVRGGVRLEAGEAEQFRAPQGLVRQAMRRLLANRTAVFGGLVILALALIALVAPLITPYDPIDMDLSRKLQPPGGRFPLGTDEFGRDILSRIILGSRISLQVGLISVGIAAIFGTVV